MKRHASFVASAPQFLAAMLVVLIGATYSTGGIETSGALSSSPPTTVPGSWTVYHHDVAGRGVADSVGAVDTSKRTWTSPTLDGQLYGEPLVSGGRVYVATENDTVYALSVSTGAVVWATHVGSPVPSSDLPCGNIQPTVGITGTPVIDRSRAEIFVVADELVGGRSVHVLVGLDLASGRTAVTQGVDPPGAITAALLQRTGLTLAAGQVVFGFGGNYGDCSAYKGWVVAVDEAGGKPIDFAVDAAAGESHGGIWMGGAAAAVDGSGHVWVTAGNGSVTSPTHGYDNSDSVLELTTSLKLVQFFAPTTWASDNAHDLDLSMAPALLTNGQVVVAGKARIAYLLDGVHLGGIGGQLATRGTACGDDVDGGSAVVGTVAYLPCLNGIIAVQADASPVGLRLLWSSGTGGGPPIVAAGLIWTIGQDGNVYGLDPSTGGARQQASIGRPANHFPTPSVGGGLLLAADATRVVAFAAGSAGASTTTTRRATTSTSANRLGAAVTSTADSGPTGFVVAGSAVVGLAVAGAIGWLLWRRRISGSR